MHLHTYTVNGTLRYVCAKRSNKSHAYTISQLNFLLRDRAIAAIFRLLRADRSPLSIIYFADLLT